MKTAVYIIGWEDGHPLKIGMAKNVRKRLKSLQTGCHQKLRVFGVRWFHNRSTAKLAEALLQAKLAPRKLKGEWFDVTIQEAKDAANEALGERDQMGSGVCVKLSQSKVPTTPTADNANQRRRLEFKAIKGC